MGWILSSGSTRLKLKPGQVIGRGDFPFNAMLSRRHFEILIRDGRVFVQDLKSTNGTVLGDRRLQPLVPAEMFLGDSLRVGKSEFTLHVEADAKEADGSSRWPVTVRADAVVLGALVLATFAQPSLAFGRSVGWWGSTILLGYLLLSFLPAVLIWGFAFRKAVWTPKKYLSYALATGLTAAFFNLVLLSYADRSWSVGEDLVQSQIEYFCLNNFRRAECVRQVNLCPACALRIERWKRDLMLRNLQGPGRLL